MATAAVAVPTANFVLLGAAPCYVEKQGSTNILLAVAASLPAANAAGISLNEELPERNFGFSGQNVYGRSLGPAAARAVVITYT